MEENLSNQQKFDLLIEMTTGLMEKTHVPGVSMGILLGEEEFSVGLGVTSIENPLPVTPETLFHIGSTNKTITAAAIFILLEQGKLKLDERVRQYIPDFKVADEDTAARVTIRHLLNHTSGWMGDFALDTGEGDDALQKFIAAMANLPQFTPLGEIFTYNNVGFNVAGRIIEVVTGRPYEAAMREMILEPLGMAHSFYFPHEVMLHRFSVGHVHDGTTAVNKPWSGARSNAPCGARLNSNIPDQLHYARFHLGQSGRAAILQPETLKMMQTPGVITDAGGWMGLNWFIKETGGVRYLEHGGSTNGQQSAFGFCPQKNFAMTIFTNEERGFILHFQLTSWIQEHLLGIPIQEPAIVKLSAGKLDEFAGRYLLKASGDVFEIQANPDGFVLAHVSSGQEDANDAYLLPPMQAGFYSANNFTVLDEPFKGVKGDFLRNPDDQITWLRFSGRVFERLS